MWFDPDKDIKVTFWAISYGFTVLTQANGSPIVNTGRDFKFNCQVFALGAFAAANAAELLGDFAFPFTLWARCGLLDVTKDGTHNIGDLATAAAVIAGLQFMAGFNGCAFAVFTDIFQVKS